MSVKNSIIQSLNLSGRLFKLEQSIIPNGDPIGNPITECLPLNELELGVALRGRWALPAFGEN